MAKKKDDATIQVNEPETNQVNEPAVLSRETPAVKKELVEVFVMKGNANDEPNLFVGINGVNYLLPRGKTSSVPPAVAAEIIRSGKAQEVMDEHIDQMLEASK